MPRFFLLALLAACLPPLGGAASASAQSPLPLETLSAYGCDIHHVEGRWTVHAWAAHGGDHDWQLYLANQSDLPKAAKVCARWIKQVEKSVVKKTK